MLKTLLRNAPLRNKILTAALAIPAVALTAQTALAGKTDFRVYNGSSMTLTHLYVSDSSLDSWDNDILGQSVLPSGYNIQVVFSDPSPNRCLYDVRAIFADGQVLEDYRINVCNSSDYTFFDE